MSEVNEKFSRIVAENAQLNARVKRALSTNRQNSSNSSKPPSSDGLKRKTKSPKTKSNTKAGR